MIEELGLSLRKIRALVRNNFTMLAHGANIAAYLSWNKLTLMLTLAVFVMLFVLWLLDYCCPITNPPGP